MAPSTCSAHPRHPWGVLRKPKASLPAALGHPQPQKTCQNGPKRRLWWHRTGPFMPYRHKKMVVSGPSGAKGLEKHNGLGLRGPGAWFEKHPFLLGGFLLVQWWRKVRRRPKLGGSPGLAEALVSRTKKAPGKLPSNAPS